MHRGPTDGRRPKNLTSLKFKTSKDQISVDDQGNLCLSLIELFYLCSDWCCHNIGGVLEGWALVEAFVS